MMTSSNENYFIDPSNIGENEYNQFHKDGFVFIKDVISQADVKSLHNRVSPLFHGNFETGIFPDEWHWRKDLSRDDVTREMVNAWKCDREFARITLGEKLGKIAAKLMGWSGARIAQDDIFWKPNAGKAIGFHQDQPYINFFKPNDVATMWIALTDVSKSNGTLEYVKGSHKWPVYKKLEDFQFHAPNDYMMKLKEAAKEANQSDYELIPLEFSAGTCSFHHGMLWHGSATNPSSDNYRMSYAIHFIPSDTEFNPEVKPGTIYGRYKIYGSQKLEESFFPITYRNDGYSSECIKSYIGLEDK